mgnify:CR=1 FL=1
MARPKKVTVNPAAPVESVKPVGVNVDLDKTLSELKKQERGLAQNIDSLVNQLNQYKEMHLQCVGAIRLSEKLIADSKIEKK